MTGTRRQENGGSGGTGRPAAARPARWAVALLLVALLGAGIGVTVAAFSGQTSNPGNSFHAAASFGNMRLATGSYTGDATDNRAITGVPFQPDAVIVKGDTTTEADMRTSSMSGDAAKPMVGPNALTADLIQSLDPSGFTIGASFRVNAPSTSYYWIAFKTGGGLKVGSYTGNGTSQSITGVGFSPEYVIALSEGPDAAVQRFSGMTTSFQFAGTDVGAPDRITSLDADGFSVGANAEVNTTGTKYHYVALNDLAGSIDMSSYVGDGADNRSITGVGFQPQYVIVRANDTTVARRATHRPASLTGTNSLVFDPVVNAAGGIKALEADGFQVGTSISTNSGGVTYHYLAVKDGGG
jgi:hypothetical protein